MGGWVIVWDIETVPDLGRFALANGFEGKSDTEVRAALGDKFPKHINQTRELRYSQAAPPDNYDTNIEQVHAVPLVPAVAKSEVLIDAAARRSIRQLIDRRLMAWARRMGVRCSGRPVLQRPLLSPDSAAG
jgi:hypothetical protein